MKNDVIDIQSLGLKLVDENITENSRLFFKDDWFRFYIDTCGQRDHIIEPFIAYGHRVEDQYVIKRKLSFTNPEDVGKDGAVLGTIDLTKCKVASICSDKIVFENFTIIFKWKT